MSRATQAKFCELCGYNVELHKPVIVKGRRRPGCPEHLINRDVQPLPGVEGSGDWKYQVTPVYPKKIGGVFTGPVPGSANERQVGAEDHVGGGYGADGVIQHWDYAASQKFDYFQGQITKYVTRWKKKGGLKDLQKAAHFLDKYIEVHEKFRNE